MTTPVAHERAMRAYVRARIKDGWLADGAARDCVEAWNVKAGPERDELVDRLSTVTLTTTIDEGSES